MRSHMWNAFRRRSLFRVLTTAIFFAGAIVILLFPCPVLALTIRVPADQSPIQAGLDVAAPTDTVLVAAGTYSGPGNQDLDFAGKARPPLGGGRCDHDPRGQRHLPGSASWIRLR